jgi:hypothetical protein
VGAFILLLHCCFLALAELILALAHLKICLLAGVCVCVCLCVCVCVCVCVSGMWAVMFPTAFTHVHAGVAPVSEAKYNIVNFITIPRRGPKP